MAFGTLWAHHIDCPAGQWTVLQRNALWKMPETKIPLKALGLDPANEYLVFDFWSGKFLGTGSGKIILPALRSGDSLTYIILPPRTGR